VTAPVRSVQLQLSEHEARAFHSAVLEALAADLLPASYTDAAANVLEWLAARVLAGLIGRPWVGARPRDVPRDLADHADRPAASKRARSTPLVPILSQRLAALAMCERFTGDADYVFCTAFGERLGEKRIRKVFYAALGRAGLGHRRDAVDPRGNPQLPIRLHDLRHSWCTWAVNVWPLTRVQAYAGHRDVKTTQRYVHHQTKAQDADLGGAYLDAALGQPTLAGVE
jgi:integrase